MTLRLRGWRGVGQKRFGGPARHGKALPKTAIRRHQRCLVLCEPLDCGRRARRAPRLKKIPQLPGLQGMAAAARGASPAPFRSRGGSQGQGHGHSAACAHFLAAAANTYDGNATRSAKSILAVNATGYAPHLSARIQSLLLGDGRGISHSVQAKCVRAGRAVGAADDVCRLG